MKLYKTKKNCGKLLLGILAFCTGMILLTGFSIRGMCLLGQNGNSELIYKAELYTKEEA